jgi:flagellar biosynthesis/type III secretory pathway chaperone
VEQGDFIQILSSLQDELELYRRLLEVLKEERKALVRNDMAGLSSLMPLKESIIDEIRESEKARYPVMKRAAETLGVNIDELSLPFLRQYVPEDLKGDFDRLEREALSVLVEVERTNAQNADLLSEAMSYIKFLIDLLVERSGGGEGIKILDKKL